MLAWAQLLGTQFGSASSGQDISAAYEIFKELAETGLPSAHMVCKFFLYVFIWFFIYNNVGSYYN